MSNVTYAVIVAVDNTDGTLTTGVQATVKFETQATGATEMEETKTAGKTETIGASETEEAGGKSRMKKKKLWLVTGVAAAAVLPQEPSPLHISREVTVKSRPYIRK